MRWLASTWTALFASDELADQFDFASGSKISMFVPVLIPYRLSGFRCRVFVECGCEPCAVVAALRSSNMVVVCLSEPRKRRIPPAHLRLERFASRSHFSVGEFMMYSRSELRKSMLGGEGGERGRGFTRLRWNCSQLASVCTFGRCWS